MPKARRRPVQSPQPVPDMSLLPPPRDISFQEIIGRQQVEIAILNARVDQLTTLLLEQTGNDGGNSSG
jgi:hypothetical protein